MAGQPVRSTGSSRLLFLFCAAAVLLAYPVAGLYPFRWSPPQAVPNTAEPVPGGGLAFNAPGPGIARTEGAPDWLSRAIEENRLEIGLRVRPDRPDQRGPARILSLSAGILHRNLTVGQEGADLIIRLRTPRTDANGKPATRVPGVFATTGWRELSIAVSPGTLEVGVDGETLLRSPIPDRPMRDWDRSFRLALGNELTNNRPWLGEIGRAMVRVGGQEIDYAKPGLLVRPATLWLFDRPPRLVPLRGMEPLDAVVNLLGFLPLGILLGAYLGPRRRLLRGLGVVVLTSLAIEGLQFFVPGRVPAVDDLFLNSCGGAIGLWVGGRMGKAGTGLAP